MSRIRFLLVSDLHGSDLVLNKTINAAKFYGVTDVIVAGDLTGKLLVPIVDNGNGSYTLELFGEVRTVQEAQLPEAEKKIRSNGGYFKIVSREEYAELESDKAKVKGAFLDEMKRTVDAFVSRAEERLRPLGARIYVIPGNDEYEEIAAYLNSCRSDVVIPFDLRIIEFGGDTLLAGFGYSNPTPWHTPRELPEEEILAKLQELMAKADPSRTLLVSHVPPFGTAIDKAPKLGPNFQPELLAGEFQMVSVGSPSVRSVIERFEPLMGLHGHIHESYGIDYVRGKGNGRRIPIVNPGSDYSSGILRGAVLELNDGKLKHPMFTRG